MMMKNIQKVLKKGTKNLLARQFCSSQQNDSNNNVQKKQNLKILEHELLNNPEFDRAHPQFSAKKPKTTIEKSKQNLDFLESLNLVSRTNTNLTQEDLAHQNYQSQLEGYKSPSGPMKWMEEQEKEKLHILIDDKMNQLENSELSREEILYDDGRKGLPLSKDPFFQFIKNNKTAREMFIKPGEEFTVQKVIDIALRQDIGYDPSQARSQQHLPQTQKLEEFSNIQESGNWNNFDPNQYFSQYSSSTQSYLKEFLKPDRKVFHMPLSESEKRKKNQRKINYFDIHWRNTELLSQFMNAASNIKNHKQNKLSQNQQKRVAKAIKVAREMALLPYIGTVKPSDKKSLTTLQEDLDSRTKMAINMETGHIYVKGQEPTSEKVARNIQEKIGNDYELSIQERMPEDNEQVLVQARVQAAKLKENQLLQQGVDPESLKQSQNSAKNSPVNSKELGIEHNQAVFPGNYHLDDVLPEKIALLNTKPEEIEASYKKISEQINQKNITQLSQLLFAEKSYEYSYFVNQEQESKEQNKQQQQNEEEELSYEQSLEILNNIRQMGDLQPLTSI